MPVFRRTTTATPEPAEPAVEATDEPAARAGAKGRPTPKRRDQVKRHRGPLAAPATRKEAYARRREGIKDNRRVMRQALLTGDEANLPPRDAGPARRLARDVIDSRLSVGEYFIPIIVVGFVVTLTPVPIVRVAGSDVLLLVFVAALTHAFLLGRRAKRAVEDRYGKKDAYGVGVYAATRALQLRRMRRPPAKVRRGAPVG